MTARTYPTPDWSKPYVLRIDSRTEKTVMEELFKNPESYIAVPVNKRFANATYRDGCMHGMPHPLSIEKQHYVLITVLTQSVDAGQFAQSDDPAYQRSNRFTPLEQDFINSVQLRPEIEWAIDNSFDGIYVRKYDDFARNATSFKFAVYMKEEQATFWKLKFSGQ